MKHAGLITLLALLPVAAGAQSDSDRRLEQTVIRSDSRELDVGAGLLDADGLVRQMADTIEDTVRYIPGVQVNDTGNRFNDDGFNIRGFEGDFVAVTVDGIDQGETLNPPSFSAYGMFGSSRGAVEIETIKAVRITKGPNSVTAGNGALSGAVAYQTKDPSDYLSGLGNDSAFGFKTGYDSRSDETMGSASIANRIGRFESLLIYTFRDGHEYKSHRSGEDIPGPERGRADPLDREGHSLLAKAYADFGDRHRLGIVYELSDREAQVTPLSRQSLAYYDFKADDTSDRQRIGLSYEWKGLEFALFDSLEATADYQVLDTRGVTRFGYAVFTFSDPTDDYLRTEDRAFKQKDYTFGIDFSKALQFGDVSHDLAYGIEYERSKAVNELFDIRYNGLSMDSGLRSFTEDPTWIPKTDIDQFTAYLHDQITLTDGLTLAGGVRFDTTGYDPKVSDSFSDVTGDAVNDADFNAFVGELGISYEFAEGHSVIASVGQGYKAPTTQDLYLDVGGAYLTDIVTGQQFADVEEISNPNLKPEHSTNYELSYVYASDRATLQLTGFYSKYDDLIQHVSAFNDYSQPVTYMSCGRGGCTPVTIMGDEFTRAENLGSVDVHGFEVDGRVLLGESWFLTFGYSLVEGEHNDSSLTPESNGYSKGDELATASPDSATLGLRYDAPHGNWGLSSYLVWTDGRGESDDHSIRSLNNGRGPAHYPDSWTTLDAFGYYEFEAYNLRLSVAVRNILNEDYIRWEVINGVRPGTGGFSAARQATASSVSRSPAAACPST